MNITTVGEKELEDLIESAKWALLELKDKAPITAERAADLWLEGFGRLRLAIRELEGIDPLAPPPPPPQPPAAPEPKPSESGAELTEGPVTCDVCARVIPIGAWPWCPHGEPRYGWHFAQFQNDARRESFFKQAAENPFGI